MARMIPSYIDQEDPKLNAERKVFKWLSDDRVDGIVLHSLQLKNHSRKRSGEIDFLLINNRGFLCIEVKGGRIRRYDGDWYSINRNNIEYKLKESPFRQVETAMYALRDYITKRCNIDKTLAKALYGYAVVMPDCNFTYTDPEIINEILFDEKMDTKNFSQFIKKAFDYWTEDQLKKQGYKRETLNNNYVNKAFDLLRGDFSIAFSMFSEIKNIEKSLEELTEEQFDALESTELNDRVLVSGVAGTGKSLLALEKFRQELAKGNKPLYVCFNRHMAALANRAIANTVSKEKEQEYYAVTFHKLLLDYIKKHSGSDYSVNEETIKNMPDVFLSMNISVDQYDYLIVDEAQDLMDYRIWECLDKFLTGGLNKGKWVSFYDPNQNIFTKSEEFDFTLEYINEKYSPVKLPLTRNCRNTKQIGQQTAMLTAVPSAKHMKVMGPDVTVVGYSSENNFISKLRHHINSIISSGILPKNIVILSKYKFSTSLLKEVDIINCNIKDTSNSYTIDKFNGIRYYTIQSFKGLEAQVIMLVDVDGFTSPYDRALNYVGMSRAKALLYIFYDEKIRDEYEKMVIDNITLI